jgi:hypothetical protein
LLAVGENRAFGSNDGYQDEPEAHYAWDSTVPNHARLMPGDAVVLWDKHSSIGKSVIESIDSRPATKTVYSRPSCGMAHIKARRTKTPRYICFRCHAEFEVPSSELKRDSSPKDCPGRGEGWCRDGGHFLRLGPAVK